MKGLFYSPLQSCGKKTSMKKLPQKLWQIFFTSKIATKLLSHDFNKKMLPSF